MIPKEPADFASSLERGVFPDAPDLLTIQRNHIRIKSGLLHRIACASLLVEKVPVGGFVFSSQAGRASMESGTLRIGGDLIRFKRRGRFGHWLNQGEHIAKCEDSFPRRFLSCGSTEVRAGGLEMRLKMPTMGPSFHQVRSCFLQVLFENRGFKLFLERPHGQPQLLFPNEFKAPFAELPRAVLLVLIW